MDNVTELLEYSCGHCKQSSWKIYIGYRDDNEVFLVVSCANLECQKTQHKEIGKALDSLLIYDEFNITKEWEARKEAGDVNEDPPEELN